MSIFHKNLRVLAWCHMNHSHATQFTVGGVGQVSMGSGSSDHGFPNARQALDSAVFVFDVLFLIRSRKLVSNTTSAHYVVLIRSDARARLVIPSHPSLKPHARMLHHFRFLLPLLPKDEEGLSELHYYDSAIQLVRTVDREPTEEEYQRGMDAAASILQMCVSF
jgi:hypothetical protein